LNLLAVETSTELCSAALLCGNELLEETRLAPNQHAEHLAPMIGGLLERAGLRPAALDALAFGQGPGSFTGIRIACGIVQGMALGLGCPVVPVPSLLALAVQSGAVRVITGLDARMGETYLAAWERGDDGWRATVSPCLAKAGQLPSLAGSDWVATGSGFDAFDWLRAAYGPQVAWRVEGDLPRAGALARLAADQLARGGGVLPEEAAPLYLRDKVALTTAERQSGR